MRFHIQYRNSLWDVYNPGLGGTPNELTGKELQIKIKTIDAIVVKAIDLLIINAPSEQMFLKFLIQL